MFLYYHNTGLLDRSKTVIVSRCVPICSGFFNTVCNEERSFPFYIPRLQFRGWIATSWCLLYVLPKRKQKLPFLFGTARHDSRLSALLGANNIVLKRDCILVTNTPRRAPACIGKTRQSHRCALICIFGSQAMRCNFRFATYPSKSHIWLVHRRATMMARHGRRQAAVESTSNQSEEPWFSWWDSSNCEEQESGSRSRRARSQPRASRAETRNDDDEIKVRRGRSQSRQRSSSRWSKGSRPSRQGELTTAQAASTTTDPTLLSRRADKCQKKVVYKSFSENPFKVLAIEVEEMPPHPKDKNHVVLKVAVSFCC